MLPVGGGQLTIGPRPRNFRVPEGIGVVVSLIQPDEGLAKIGLSASENGVKWYPFPFSIRRGGLRLVDPRVFTTALRGTMRDLEAEASVLIHCAEGLHRSGIYTYGLLRLMGCNQFDAMDLISMLRPETARALATPLREWTEWAIKRGFRLGWHGRMKN
jgi:hypothetical protein